ncbi:DUF1648 domain-containing protein [Cohnella sp. CFH 77786]|uniref:SdpI family protein n=1 Tax=Cohnella sp. CFH 77786 TaxID=2662265 RepID=UPI001C60ECA4|nr:SdpI family protein [Cohnella sp. CFH 77786]MBW5448433.1 DUF1648 domain-containing protein [Cohnella sp. CFH 77786]
MNATVSMEHKNRRILNELILFAFNAAVWLALYLIFNDRLPGTIASHYNLQGEANGWMSKTGFWWMAAGLTVILPSVFHFLRLADKRNANNPAFGLVFELFRWGLALFLHGVMLSLILDNIGRSIPMNNVILGGFGLFWAIIGNRMGQVRSNPFLGFRTPWTLSDENNWKRTHRFGARLMFATGLAMFAAAWFVSQPLAIILLVVGVTGSSIISSYYSYVFYARSRKG